MSKFEPSFDPCYVQGYTSALQDVLKTIIAIQPDMKMHNRKQSAKTYKDILQCMIENRTVLREAADAFVRCTSGGVFEVWREEWNG